MDCSSGSSKTSIACCIGNVLVYQPEYARYDIGIESQDDFGMDCLTFVKLVSINTAVWIREFLLHSKDDNLFFSSKEYFEELLDTYNHDPCDDEHVS